MDDAAALACLRTLLLNTPAVAAALTGEQRQQAEHALGVLAGRAGSADEPGAKRARTGEVIASTATDAPVTTTTTTTTATATGKKKQKGSGSAADAAGVKSSVAFLSFARSDDVTPDLQDPAEAALAQPPEGFGTPLGTEYTHAVGDLVWVKLIGYPAWPGELLKKDHTTTAPKSKKYPFPARLFHPPGKYAEHDGVTFTNTRNITYFDRLRTEGELTRCLKYRLMSDRYDTKAYEALYETAVRTANAHVRAIMTPEALLSYPVTPVGIAYTNFRAHYQAPRQPHANEQVKKETGVIVLRDGLENLVRDLGKFERIWVVFQFSYAGTTNRARKKAQGGAEGEDDHTEFFSGWKAMIVPPRDNKPHGLYATRSPHRPNAIGLSCCKVLNVSGKVVTIRDHDLLHGTPILDIKPYLPYCDAHPNAAAGWVDDLGDNAGPDHRWNEQEYSVHRRMQVGGDAGAKATSHS